MAGQIIINAKNIIGNASGTIQDDAKTIKNVTGKKFAQNGKNGVKNDKNEERKPVKTETTQVKTIELITPLDDGSKNDKSGGIQKGMVFGKNYSFKVKDYTNGLPKDKSKIKWMVKYQSPELSKNKWIEIPSKITGENYTIFVNEKDMCGRFVFIRAYINDAKTEGELKIWKHNRFRWFDRKIVHEQIAERVKNAWKIDQGTTSLCGMACIFYLLAKKDSKGYEKLGKELFRVGEYKHNEYVIEPHKDATEMYDINPYKDSKHPKLPEIDWITMALVRSKESSLFGKILYKGKKGQDGAAINWPWLMKPLGKKLLGYKTVEMDYYKVNKSYIRDFFGSDEKIRILEKDIDADYKNGFEICMMIDGDMVSNKADYDLTDLGEYHWIVYEGGLQMTNSKGTIETDYDDVTDIKFDIFTWGEEVHGKSRISKGISKKAFRNNYYGYLKLK